MSLQDRRRRAARRRRRPARGGDRVRRGRRPVAARPLPAVSVPAGQRVLLPGVRRTARGPRADPARRRRRVVVQPAVRCGGPVPGVPVGEVDRVRLAGEATADPSDGARGRLVVRRAGLVVRGCTQYAVRGFSGSLTGTRWRADVGKADTIGRTQSTWRDPEHVRRTSQQGR